MIAYLISMGFSAWMRARAGRAKEVATRVAEVKAQASLFGIYIACFLFFFLAAIQLLQTAMSWVEQRLYARNHAQDSEIIVHEEADDGLSVLASGRSMSTRVLV
jgi:hypothetical protein